VTVVLALLVSDAAATALTQVGRIASLLGHSVEVTNVEVSYADEVIRKFARHCVTRNVFDLEVL